MCLHRTINQQWTKKFWEEISHRESNDTKYHQKVEKGIILLKSPHGKGNPAQAFNIFYQMKCSQSAVEYVSLRPSKWLCKWRWQHGPESQAAPLESDEGTQLDDTQPEYIQGSESNLAAIVTTPLSKKQIYWARFHFLQHLPTIAYGSLKVFRWYYIRLGKDINLVDNLKDMNIE